MKKVLPSSGKPSSRHRKIAWWTYGKGAYAHEVLKGVLDYIHDHQPWVLHQMRELPDSEWPAWEGDGILACCWGQPIQHLAEQVRLPFVDISDEPCAPFVSSVETDNAAVGRLAAEHLLERGLKHFAFCGFSGFKFSDDRRDAFMCHIQQTGFSCAEAVKVSSHPLPALISAWLAALPKPVGILADPIDRGQEILAACRRGGLSVPEEVAIITVKSANEVGLLFENPPLSSVRLNANRVGYEAAALLDQMMEQHPLVPPGTVRLIAPLGVEARQSTDMLAIPDRYVAAALRHIWQHACEGIQVKDLLLEVAPKSRRLFEYRFHQFVGRTPHEEIIRVRMNRAKELLTGTDLPLKQIAVDTGFTRAEHLVTTFRQAIGLPPGKYRDQHAAKDG